MEKGQWTKSPPELVAAFQAVAPGPPATTRPMFGYPACFIDGNMFMSLFQDHMVLRLPEGPREELLAEEGAGILEPMPGRPMKEYVIVPPDLLADAERLTAWVDEAFAYGKSLPPKASKAPAPKARAKAKAKARPEP